ncbi:hypothetical protein HUU05_24115, partial [candidate division KSB1 bacterium]|nr:hypothetical protein [candidate division KSB1 bacterium]
IPLTPEIENALAQCAQREGTTPEQLALETLRKRFASFLAAKAPADEKLTLYDLIKDHIGVIDSSEKYPEGGHMSENTGKKFAAGMKKKREQGRL